MIAVVVVEAAPWLGSVLARVAAGERVVALAALVPQALRVAQRVWARGDAGRRMEARLVARRLADRLAAASLPAAVRLVVAPSGAAERTFAAARERGVATLLVNDVPLMRRLHDDLDAAARRHRDAAFLRRYRAPARDVARQEAERVLADRIVVRGAYARDALLRDGVPESKLVMTDDPPVAPRRPRPRGPRRLLLAGLATARSGTREALAARELAVDAELLVRAGEGLDPGDLLLHPRVRAATRAERDTLDGVHAVLAPAWCESYASEVALAARLGVPVVATARGAGAVDLARAGVEVAPGDVDALARAIAALP